jgi:3-hydroxyacyl-CoA dehydrogenase
MLAAEAVPRRVVLVGEGFVCDQLAAALSGSPCQLSVIALPTAMSEGRLREVFAADRCTITDADWIMEASGRSGPAKAAVLAALGDLRASHALLTTDESVTPLAALRASRHDMPPSRIAITHVFVPLAQLPLVEIATVPGDRDSAAMARTALKLLPSREFLDCVDAPGFAANRFGLFAAAAVADAALADGVPIEVADATFRELVGGRSGCFELFDLIGLAVSERLLRELQRTLPAEDAFPSIGNRLLEQCAHFLARGVGGRASGRGFYLKSASGLMIADAEGGYRAPRTSEAVSWEWRTALQLRLSAYLATVAGDQRLSLARMRETMHLGYGWTLSGI